MMHSTFLLGTWPLAIGHNFQGLRFALHVQLSGLTQVEHQDHADGYDSLALRMNDHTVKTSRILQENQDGWVLAISGRVQLLQSGYESINLRFPLHSLARVQTSSASGRMQEHQADYEGRKLEISRNSWDCTGKTNSTQLKHAKPTQTCWNYNKVV